MHTKDLLLPELNGEIYGEKQETSTAPHYRSFTTAALEAVATGEAVVATFTDITPRLYVLLFGECSHHPQISTVKDPRQI